MVRDVRKAESAKYLAQAEEFLQSAMANMEAGRYNAAVFSAIQAMINANDALTIYFLEKRASSDHRECLKLHSDAADIIKDTSQKDRLREAISLRSRAGYMGEWMSKREAERIQRHATRFIVWVSQKIK